MVDTVSTDRITLFVMLATFVGGAYLLWMLAMRFLRTFVTDIGAQLDIRECVGDEWVPLEVVAQRMERVCGERKQCAFARLRAEDPRVSVIARVQMLSKGVVMRNVTERWEARVTVAWIATHGHLLDALTPEDRRRYENLAERAANILMKRAGESWRHRVRRLEQDVHDMCDFMELHTPEYTLLDPESTPDDYMRALEREVERCCCKLVTLLRRKPTLDTAPTRESSGE